MSMTAVLRLTRAEHPATTRTGPADLDLPFATMGHRGRASEVPGAGAAAGPGRRRTRRASTVRARATAVSG